MPSLREVYYAQFAHVYPMHTHDAWTVLLVDDGTVTYGLDGAQHQATVESLTLLPPGVPHDGHSAVDGKGYRKRVLYLEPDWLPSNALSIAASLPTITSPGALAAGRRVHAALDFPGDLMAAEHWLLAVRSCVLDHLGTPEMVRPDAPLARRLRLLLDDRLTESFTIAAAAQELGTHPSHLVRAFSRAYGIAPHQYQVSRRVDLARRLLVAGHKPADVAARVGFYDQAHLIRHFRRVLGVTPATFVKVGRFVE